MEIADRRIAPAEANPGGVIEGACIQHHAIRLQCGIDESAAALLDGAQLKGGGPVGTVRHQPAVHALEFHDHVRSFVQGSQGHGSGSRERFSVDQASRGAGQSLSHGLFVGRMKLTRRDVPLMLGILRQVLWKFEDWGTK